MFDEYSEYDACPDEFVDDFDNIAYCYLVEGHAGTHECQTDHNEIVNWD